MAVDCAWIAANGSDQLQSHIADDLLCAFVAHMIDQAWQASANAGVRNGLADCARYLGEDYPLDSIPPKSA